MLTRLAATAVLSAFLVGSLAEPALAAQPSSSQPAGADGKDSKDKKKPAPAPLAKPRPSQPAPKPAPSKPSPSQPSKPAPSQPSPSRPSTPSTPSPSKPAPSTPAQPSTPSKPTPSTPSQPTPSKPTPSQPTPGQPSPTPAQPTSSPGQPTPAQPASSPGQPSQPGPASPSSGSPGQAGQSHPAAGSAGAPSGATTTSRAPRHDTRSDAEAAHVSHPPGSRTDAERAADHRAVQAHHSSDHRYARPRPAYVRQHPEAHHAPPAARWYRAYYTRWWVHPYYRWVHATVAFALFDYEVYAWTAGWAPPPRTGWVWVPGHMEAAWWVPGHWMPVGPVPVSYGGRWTYVPGWWVGDRYLEGYYRAADRGPAWVWVEGAWTGDGVYRWGHWEPVGHTPSGYIWEPGYWDGEDWVDGFWRPALRNGYRWVSAAFNEDGIFEGGYWEPMEQRPDCVWIPGWFDGTAWVDGYWVTNAEYSSAKPDTYNPPPGTDDGWDTSTVSPTEPATDEQPLAIPVE